jgi:hypothetical protein
MDSSAGRQRRRADVHRTGGRQNDTRTAPPAQPHGRQCPLAHPFTFNALDSSHALHDGVSRRGANRQRSHARHHETQAYAPHGCISIDAVLRHQITKKRLSNSCRNLLKAAASTLVDRAVISSRWEVGACRVTCNKCNAVRSAKLI